VASSESGKTHIFRLVSVCVHGAEDAKIYAVTRYNLEFWECRRCHDQNALLIIEEMIELRWRRRNEYQESYKYGSHSA